MRKWKKFQSCKRFSLFNAFYCFCMFVNKHFTYCGVHISKSRSYVKSWAYYFYVTKKISTDFHTCNSVPLKNPHSLSYCFRHKVYLLPIKCKLNLNWVSRALIRGNAIYDFWNMTFIFETYIFVIYIYIYIYWFV